MKVAVLSLIVASVIAFGSFVSAMEYRYGPRIQVVMNSKDVKRHGLKHRIRTIQERIWDLERDFGYDFRIYPQKYAREYKELMAELKLLQDELNKL